MRSRILALTALAATWLQLVQMCACSCVSSGMSCWFPTIILPPPLVSGSEITPGTIFPSKFRSPNVYLIPKLKLVFMIYNNRFNFTHKKKVGNSLHYDLDCGFTDFLYASRKYKSESNLNLLISYLRLIPLSLPTSQFLNS